MWILIIVLASIAFIPMIITVYAFKKSDILPESRPATYLRLVSSQEIVHPVVLFAGDSLTHGKVGVGYLELLEEKHNRHNMTIINAGINGDFVWNLLQRIDEIVECAPDAIFILIGTNDALATLPIRFLGIAQRRKGLPRPPAFEWYIESLRSLVKNLIERTPSKVVLMSIPPIGETLDSKANVVAMEYSRAIRDIAMEMNVGFIPVNEMMNAYLAEHPSHPAFPLKNAIKGMSFALIRHYIFGKDWDSLSQDSGQVLHIDHIHLNSAGARIIAELVSSYLSKHFF